MAITAGGFTKQKKNDRTSHPREKRELTAEQNATNKNVFFSVDLSNKNPALDGSFFSS